MSSKNMKLLPNIVNIQDSVTDTDSFKPSAHCSDYRSNDLVQNHTLFILNKKKVKTKKSVYENLLFLFFCHGLNNIQHKRSLQQTQ